MESQVQLTKKVFQIKKIVLGALTLIGLSVPASVEPLGFNSPFTQDIEIFVNSRFEQDEKAVIGDDQRELFMQLLDEAKNHPDLLESLPAELQAEIKVWQKRGKSL